MVLTPGVQGTALSKRFDDSRQFRQVLSPGFLAFNVAAKLVPRYDA